MKYQEFLQRKSQLDGDYGFDPVWMPGNLFAFQKSLVEWACRKGRAAIFADCGLGKTPMQLTWAENVARKTDGKVLILTPLAVAFQTVKEGEKFGIEVKHRREGIKPGDRIVVTNYERLHLFNADDFTGVVCDESSILKNFDGETRKAVTDFLRKRPYRLLCTATAAPNDYLELGTSSEALGVLERKHMLAQFFTHDGGDTSSWVLKGHARSSLFWRWVGSWARAMRKPSDIGFEDGAFRLPPLDIRQHVVTAARPRDGYLFDIPAIGLEEQRADLRNTIAERCEMAAQLVNATEGPSLCWCNLNEEGVRLNKMIPNSVEVAGHHSDEFKEDAIRWFSGEMCNCVLTTKHPHVRLQPCTHGKDGCKCERQKKTKSTCEITTALIAANTNEQESNKTNTTRGDASCEHPNTSKRTLISKPTIFGFGVNLQHCAHQTYFPSHSYEQYYQCVRRCWRFGQKHPVTVDMITTNGQENVLANLQRKTVQASAMFDRLVEMMWREIKIETRNEYIEKEEVPAWL